MKKRFVLTCAVSFLVLNAVFGGGSEQSSSPVPLFSSTSGNDNKLQTITFKAVNANDITDTLTLRVAAVNGADPQTITQSGGLQITALSEFPTSAYEFIEGAITKYNGSGGDVVLPVTTVWGDPVKAIGKGALEAKGLTSVIIPNTVTSIGDRAFANNSVIVSQSVHSDGSTSVVRGSGLSNVVIPNGVTYIGERAFSGNCFDTVIIPDSVTAIGNYAFVDNSRAENFLFFQNARRIESVTLGANVTLGRNVFDDDGFNDFYDRNGKKAGTYTKNFFGFWTVAE